MSERELPEYKIASALLQRPDGRILVLKRHRNRRVMPGKWCVVSGYVEPGEEPAQTAVREVREEVGLDVKVTRTDGIVRVPLEDKILLVYPFLCSVEQDAEIRLDWEHEDYRWIEPHEVYDLDRVPQLEDDFVALGLL